MSAVSGCSPGEDCLVGGSLRSDDGKAQSLPASLPRSACASASAVDLEGQLLRLKKFFDAHNLHEVVPTGGCRPALSLGS